MLTEGVIIAGVSLLGILIQTYRCRIKSKPSYKDQEFIWTLGGDEVFIVGQFTNWEQNKIKMTKSGDNHIYNHPKLVRGEEYQFKFIVDTDWKTSPDYKTKLNNEADRIMNNYITIDNVCPCRFVV